MDWDGADMSGYNPKTENENDELLITMKKRILASYKWHEDVIIPFAKELDISIEELEELLMKRLDMSSLEAINPRFESSKLRCLKERIHADLRLCWLCDVMNILTEEESERIQHKIAIEVLKDSKPYEKAIEEGRKDLLEDLMR
jgi:energy-converting hydrogenase A subunit M